MTIIAVVLALGLCGAVVVAAATTPRLVWPLLLVITVGTAGMMPIGYSMVDEVLTGAVLMGVLIANGLTAAPRAKEEPMPAIERVHRFFYLLLMAYMIGQSIRGTLILNSPQKLRWAVMFLMMFLVPIVLTGRRYQVPTMRKAAILLTATTCAYLIAYILHGVTAETIRGISRWSLQTREVGTTAYSLIVVAVGVPAALICLGDRQQNVRLLGWATVIIAFLAALYYESRIVEIVIPTMFLLSARRIGWKRVIGLGAGAVLLVLSASAYLAPKNIDTSYGSYLWQGVVNAATAPFQRDDPSNPPKPIQDIDRWIYMKVAFEAISGDATHMLFGHGYRMHGFKISSFVAAYYQQYYPAMVPNITEDTNTEGFTALVVDAGLVGLALVMINLGLVALRAVMTRHPYGLVIASAAGFLFAWLLVINMLDITLFYLAMMPSGLLMLLAQRPDTAPIAVRPDVRRANAAGSLRLSTSVL